MLKKGRVKNFLKWFGISFGIVFIVGLITISVLYKNQIISLCSLKQINDKSKNYPFYTMTYKENYAFDDYLKVGSKDESEYDKFIENKLGGLIKAIHPNCSSFTAVTPNGDKLLARNQDAPMAVPLFLKTTPNTGYKSMSMVNFIELSDDFDLDLPLSYFVKRIDTLVSPYAPVEGMNEHGLAVAGMTASGSTPVVKENQITLNDYTLMRMVLDKASTVDEAVKMIQNYNMVFLDPAGSHIMIADAKGNSVLIEYVNNKLETIYSDKPYHIATNFILHDNPDKYGFGSDRYKGIEAKLDETKGVLTEKEAMKLLSENTIPGDEQWSSVYNLTQKKLYICVGKDYETIHEFQLD